MMNFVNIAPFLTLAAAVIGLVFAAYKFYWVKAKPEGTAQMSGIAAKIRKVLWHISSASIRLYQSSLSVCWLYCALWQVLACLHGLSPLHFFRADSFPVCQALSE